MIVKLYILYNKEKVRYLFYDQLHKLCETDKRNRAVEFLTEGKARNCLLCSETIIENIDSMRRNIQNISDKLNLLLSDLQSSV